MFSKPVAMTELSRVKDDCASLLLPLLPLGYIVPHLCIMLQQYAMYFIKACNNSYGDKGGDKVLILGSKPE